MDVTGKALEWVRENVISVVLGGLGVLLMGVGLVQMKATGSPKDVEVISTKEDNAVETVVVDVAGGVQTPGVFEMDDGVRVADALIAAGGLSADADRDWVARFVNQAEPVRDGMKIFVPLEGEGRESTNDKQQNPNNAGMVAGAGAVNINSASISELDSLWGVGEARAKDIVENRPYGSVQELVEKAGIPENVLEKNEGK